MSLRVVIVEDEPPARARLRELLAAHADVQIVAEAATVRDGLQEVARHAPDLVLLDIRLRGGTAFDLLAALEREGREPPAVVFTTAYDEYALDAFRHAGVDYLLKPIEAEALAGALERVRRLRARAAPAAQEEVLARVRRLADALERSAGGRLQRLGIRQGDRTLVLAVEDVTHFFARDRLVHAATVRGTSHVVEFTLAELGERLDPERFARIHRGAIVNVDHVREIQRWFAGRYRVVLDTGETLTVSRQMAPNLRALVPF